MDSECGQLGLLTPAGCVQRCAPSGQVLANSQGHDPTQAPSKGVTLGSSHSWLIRINKKGTLGNFKSDTAGLKLGLVGQQEPEGLALCEAGSALYSSLVSTHSVGMFWAFKHSPFALRYS